MAKADETGQQTGRGLLAGNRPHYTPTEPLQDGIAQHSPEAQLLTMAPVFALSSPRKILHVWLSQLSPSRDGPLGTAQKSRTGGPGGYTETQGALHQRQKAAGEASRSTLAGTSSARSCARP